jgi:ribulose 1,5-bisphosphate synthetase/thiazole synthase
MDKAVAIIGGGPSGLMAAEVISARGVKVDVYDSILYLYGNEIFVPFSPLLNQLLSH